MDVAELLRALPGVGGVAGGLLVLFWGVNLYRKTTHTRERDVIRDRNDWQEGLVRRAEWAEAQLDWWRGWAGQLEYAVRSRLGPEAMPKKDPYPVKPQEPEEASKDGRAPVRASDATSSS